MVTFIFRSFFPFQFEASLWLVTVILHPELQAPGLGNGWGRPLDCRAVCLELKKPDTHCDVQMTPTLTSTHLFFCPMTGEPTKASIS